MALSLGNPNIPGNPEFVHRTGWIVLGCLLPYYALAIGDGFFLAKLVRDPLLYTLYDIAKYVVLPSLVFLFLASKLRLRAEDFFFTSRRIEVRGWEVIGIAFWWAAVLYVIFLLGEPLVMYPLAIMVEPLHWVLSQWFALPDIPWRYEARFSHTMALPDNAIVHGVAVIFLSVTAGIVEEIFYRGLFRQVIAALLGPQAVKTYIFGSALIFGLAHWEQGSTGLYNATAFGLGAAILYLKLGDLRPLILAHALIDLYIFW